MNKHLQKLKNQLTDIAHEIRAYSMFYTYEDDRMCLYSHMATQPDRQHMPNYFIYEWAGGMYCYLANIYEHSFGRDGDDDYQDIAVVDRLIHFLLLKNGE